MAYEGEQKKEYQRNWLAARRQKAIDYLGGECSDCGDIRNLEFHHINPDTKDKDIRSLLSGRWTNLSSELAKCVLLCNFCHRQETNLQQTLSNPIKTKQYRAAYVRAHRAAFGR